MTPVQDARDQSGTNGRAALIGGLGKQVAELTAAGDLAAARTLTDAMMRLLSLGEAGGAGSAGTGKDPPTSTHGEGGRDGTG